MNHPNQELIFRVKCISTALPFLEGKFNDAVEAEINRKKSPGEKGDPLDKYLKAIEPAFNELAEYKNSLAAELANRGPACTKLAVALRGGFDVPKPYAFIFDAICELEQNQTPESDPFVLHHDKMESQRHSRKAIAEAWYDQLPVSERRRLSDDQLGKGGAIRKLVKDIDNLRYKRSRNKRS